jgi:hypothetical protein
LRCFWNRLAFSEQRCPIGSVAESTDELEVHLQGQHSASERPKGPRTASTFDGKHLTRRQRLRECSAAPGRRGRIRSHHWNVADGRIGLKHTRPPAPSRRKGGATSAITVSISSQLFECTEVAGLWPLPSTFRHKIAHAGYILKMILKCIQDGHGGLVIFTYADP